MELDWRFSDICWGKKGGGREQMSSFQQKLALKGSETSIEHFAAVLKDVKDRGGWNTASALVSCPPTKNLRLLATSSFVVKLEFCIRLDSDESPQVIVVFVKRSSSI